MVKEKVAKEEEICKDCVEYGSDFCDDCLDQMKLKEHPNCGTPDCCGECNEAKAT